MAGQALVYGAGRTIYVEGIPELDQALENLSGPQAREIAQDVVLAAGEVLLPVMKSAAPVGQPRWITPKASPRYFTSGGRLQKSVGLGFGRGQQLGAGNNYSTVIVGPVAPHRHLVILGTTRRTTKTGANRGIMPANPFVARAFEAALGQMEAEMQFVYSYKIKTAWAP